MVKNTTAHDIVANWKKKCISGKYKSQIIKYWVFFFNLPIYCIQNYATTHSHVFEKNNALDTNLNFKANLKKKHTHT